MNQTALKNFAQYARRELQKQVALRLNYWVGSGGSKSPHDSVEHREFAAQIKELGAACKREGREALIERVAYTWFNRLAALRFMDANGFHPFGSKVIMPATANETMPELLQQARGGALDTDLRACLGNAKTFDGILAGAIPVEHREEALYRLLLVAACNYYHRLMPFLFERIGDATELLLPQDLLTEHSIGHSFRTELADEDCRDVEVIGWLYQYYISEKKDTVMARDTAVPKEDIPAVTQLFTPHWIVRYLVENSLGRLWLLNRPNSRLREKMPYFVESERETDFLKIGKPEEIRLLDPACGSGHMLTYGYDLLYAIYAEEGYDEKDIPGLILKHNLYGVEICDRAAALAAFALCMKARGSDNRFFRRVVQPNVISLQDVRFEEGELREYIRALGLRDLFGEPVRKLMHQFEEAKNFGSLIQPCLDEKAIVDTRHAIEAKDLGGQLFLRETHAKVLRVLDQAEYLCQRYHTVIANPPYLGSGGFNDQLRKGLEERFKVTRTDLCVIFLERSFALVVERGDVAMVTMQSWMFTTSYRDLRKTLLGRYSLSSMAHLGTRAFSSLSGEVVSTTAFVFTRAVPDERTAGRFLRLVTGDEEEKNRALLARPVIHRFAQCLFGLVPGSPIIYWKGQQLVDLFRSLPAVGGLAPFREGIHTGDNARFLRLWWEVTAGRFARSAGTCEAIDALGAKWVPYNKGGDFTRWYGNNFFVIAFDREARDAMALIRGHVRPSQSLYFKAGGTWADVGSRGLGMKFYPDGYLFDGAGPVVVGGDNNAILIGGVNSCAFGYLCELLMPNIHYKCGTVKRVPFPKEFDREVAGKLSETAIALGRADWDSGETSWDFRDLPLLRTGVKAETLEGSWQKWKAQCDAAVRRMQELETENNRLFITAYGLQDELKPEVAEEQITLARADARKDMAALVSYAVGCMFGRYSLDVPGLILADAGATVADYHRIVAERLAGDDSATGRQGDRGTEDKVTGREEDSVKGGQGDRATCAGVSSSPSPIVAESHGLRFLPDTDGILPVLDGEWFPDDIVARFREFLKVTFGEENLDANLAFVEASLGRDLRKYFFRDFYKNHLSNERAFGYKKRPIYWMFSSPEGSFQALIYLHRYTSDTVNVLLNEYVREFMHKLEERQRQLTAIRLNESGRPGDRTNAVKELGKIVKILKELRVWEREVMLPLAQQRIEIDLDDGVKANYLKFKGALAHIPGLEKKEEE